MTLMVIGEQELTAHVDVQSELPDLGRQQRLLKQLFFDPQGDRHAERRVPSGSERQIGFQQSLEFDERLLVEDNVVEIAAGDTAFIEAVRDRVSRESWVVLLARKPLLLRGRNDRPVVEETRGTVMVEGRNSENAQ